MKYIFVDQLTETTIATIQSETLPVVKGTHVLLDSAFIGDDQLVKKTTQYIIDLVLIDGQKHIIRCYVTKV